MHRIIFLSFFIITCTFLYAQKKDRAIYFGIGGVHDFQSEGTAIDLRGQVPIYKGLYLTPRFSYFPAFNNIQEYYFGADADYHFMKYQKLHPYIYLGGYYNNWINSSDFLNPRAKQNNGVLETGGGILFGFNCLSTYIEYRYDTKWKEGSLGAGLLIHFGGCFFAKKNKVKDCPHF